MTTHIIHHNDLDGYASAGIAKAFLAHKGITPVLHEMNYDRELTDVFGKDDTVYILDFSLQPFQKMEDLFNTVQDFIWIDHHASVINEYKAIQEKTGLSWGYDGLRLDGYCGAELTWAWFNLPDKSLMQVNALLNSVPAAIKLVGDWDTWRHAKIENSMAPAFKTAFDTHTPEEVIQWFENYVTKTLDHYIMDAVLTDKINQGISIEHFKIAESSSLMKSRAFNAKLWVTPPTNAPSSTVYSVIAANMGSRGSDRFASVYKPDRHDIMLGFAYENTGKVSVSLYSTHEEINCGEIAKLCGDAGPFSGGGGHKGAAGFLTSWEFLMGTLLKKEGD